MIPVCFSWRPASFDTSPNPAATSSTEKRLWPVADADAFDHAARGGHSAKPAVDAAKIAQGRFDFEGRARIRVEDFLCDDSLHDERKSPSTVPLASARARCPFDKLGRASCDSRQDAGATPTGVAHYRVADAPDVSAECQTSANSSSSSCLL